MFVKTYFQNNYFIFRKKMGPKALKFSKGKLLFWEFSPVQGINEILFNFWILLSKSPQ